MSTTAALIAAGAGCALAKHGNRSATGLSGSADVLEALGARIDLAPAAVAQCIDEAGFGFMFAPAHHQATRYVVPVRKELAVRTIFNFLGPLTNPAGARRQLIGVSDPAYIDRMAGALARLGVDRALVVSSEDGLDEMSTSAPTHVVEVNGDAIERYVVAPQDVGIEPSAARRRRRGHPRRQRGDHARDPRRRARPRARPRAAQRRRRDLRRRRWPTACARASRPLARRSTRVRPRAPPTPTSSCRGSSLPDDSRHCSTVVSALPQGALAMSVLDRIVDATRADVARRRQAVPLSELEQRAAGSREDRPFSEALTLPGISVIAEYKRRSPSAGEIRRDASVVEIVGAYERGGAAALSILTEERHFGGSLDDLREARAASALPILRKDFVVDPYQVYESTVAGADAILLIVAALDDDDLSLLHREAVGLDLDVLVEVHDEDELERALDVVDADVIGINNRDLGDFTVDVERTYELLSDVPAGKTVVSESGFHSREQLDDLERVGVDAVLIGEALMRASDVEDACRALTGLEGGESEAL